MNLSAIGNDFMRFIRGLTTRLTKTMRLVTLLLVASLLLSGCVKYDMGLSFDNSNSGELVQHIKLGERLTSFSGDPVYEWLNSIERRTRKLSGKTRRISREEIIVTIPFSNGEELQEKFNTFFNPANNPEYKLAKAETNSELPEIESNLRLFQNNLLLAVRNRLIYDLDLRSLSLISSDGNVLANANSIFDLEFSLKTPWGAKSIITNENTLQPRKEPLQLVWKLKAGELNHIETVFWLPNLIGIGALLIVLFVWFGITLRYKFMSDPTIQLTLTATGE
jgi:Protein of unknown function (DUF3153)